jgi:hypothetical protein
VGCASFGVSQILVGLFRVGVVGLKQAFDKADAAGLSEPASTLDLLMATLRAENYVPESLAVPYRRAVWREYLRHRGEDITPFFSEVPVTVQCDAAEERERVAATLIPLLAKLELRPTFTFAQASGAAGARLLIGEHAVIDGDLTRERLEAAVRLSVSDW